LTSDQNNNPLSFSELTATCFASLSLSQPPLTLIPMIQWLLFGRKKNP